MKKAVIGILAHVDAGKTTLAESLLFTAGQIKKQGRVDHRDTFLDTHELERQRGVTIFAHQALLNRGELQATLLDTPGHSDFSAEMERALQVMDYAVLVISATAGVQAHTETLWNLLQRYQLPTFIFITKMDAAEASPAALLEELREHLSPACCDFTCPDDILHEESVAMLDETALDSFVEQGVLTDADVQRLIAERRLFPCCFGSGLRTQGIAEFLDVLERFIRRQLYPAAFGGRVFKIARDEQDQRLTFIKLTGGQLAVRSSLRYLPPHGSEAIEEKISQIRFYSGRKYETAEVAEAGSICAVPGLTHSFPGQGLGVESDAELPLLQPVLGYRVTTEKGVEPRCILPQLRRLEEEDPQLHIVWQPQLEEIQLQLMGAVQIEVLRQIIAERFDLAVRFDAGRILYRETIADTVEGVGHYEPLKHYAEVHLLLQPGEPGSGIVTDCACSEDDLALNWQRLILTHLEEKQHIGVLTGSPITDMRITVVAGKAHLKHTEGGDFRQATYRALRQGLMQAKSVLLEPCFAYRLEVPAEQIGRAISDIRAMGGEYSPPEAHGDRLAISGSAPAAAMRDYLNEVVAYTRGRGRFSCHADGYRPCRNAEKVIADIAYDPEADTENSPDSVFCAHGAGHIVKWSEVRDHMHVDSGLRPDQPADSSNGTDLAVQPHPFRRQDTDIDEKELEAIMLREFGPIRRPQYRPAVIRRASDADIRLRSPQEQERLIVDGYNVIFAWDELKKLAAQELALARARLIDLLANYRGFTHSEVIVVFDAYKVEGGRGSRLEEQGVRIAFTREGETADMFIERLVAEIGRNESVRVVTSDALISLSVVRSGVSRISSREFEREMEWVLDNIRNSSR